jgi:Protein of unknown function (DUF1559)
MSSYGGNAGKRSVDIGDPPAYPRVTRDGILFIYSGIRLADITDGSSNTFLFGERFHRDTEYDRRWVGAAAADFGRKWRSGVDSSTRRDQAVPTYRVGDVAPAASWQPVPRRPLSCEQRGATLGSVSAVHPHAA